MLSVWLPLNGNLHNQGLSNITATNNGATVDNNGKIGKCYSFDGNDDFINLGDIGSYFDGSAFSICFWIYSLENKTRAAVFSSYGLSSTSNFFGLELNSSNNNYCNNNLRFDWLGGDTYSPDDFVAYNAWTHVCVTYDGVNQIKMYKNGELIQTSTRVLNAIPVGNTYYLGRDSRTGSTAFNGKLNDFRIYDHCLSPIECKQVSAALVLHYPLSMPGQENLVKQSNQFRVGGHAAKITPSVLADGTYQVIAESGNSNYTSSWWMTTDGIEDSFVEGETFTISFTIKSSDANTTTPPKIYIKSGMGYYSMNGKVTDAWSTVYYTGTWKKENSLAPHLGWAGLVGTYHIMNWKIERGSRPTPWLPNPADAIYSALGFDDGIEYDVSGYNHNGTKYGAITYDADTPRYETSTHISATDQYIKVENLDTSGFGESYTFSWWSKVSTFSNMQWGFSNGVRLNGMYTGKLWNTGDSSNNPLYIPNTTTQVTVPTTNVWHHWVMTGDGTTCRVYQDGELWGIAKTYKSISGTTLCINGWNDTTSYKNSYMIISDFRIYATALSPEDVRELYSVAASVADNGTLMASEVSEL